MASTTLTAPVLLPRWPSCNDCLTSSEDDLAVASGENIHIITPKTDDRESKQSWHVSTIRVNQFLESEWPFQKLAPSSYFSIGEEQSESIVCSLSWSPSGLGLHKRSVLGVLTSNLVLSLWETSGALGQYRRTCIVNHVLAVNKEGAPREEELRRVTRIRAFAWISSLNAGSSQQVVGHYLVIADDNSDVLVLRITKPPGASFGQFDIEVKTKFSLQDAASFSRNAQAMSPLQRRLFQESTVSQITATDWYTGDSTDPPNDETKLRSVLKLKKGSILYQLRVTATVIHGTTSVGNLKDDHVERSISISLLNGEDIQTDKQDWGTSFMNSRSVKEVNFERVFKAALKPLIRAFDQEHRLFGNHNIRWWGLCSILGTSGMAACVTFHPSDMIEHTQPSLEKCMLIFTGVPIRSQGTTKTHVSTATVQNHVLSFIVTRLPGLPPDIPKSDMIILQLWFALGRQLSFPSLDRKAFEAVLNRYSSHQDLGDTERTVLIQQSGAFETCEICTAKIPSSGDTNSARCISGHLFTRCNLSFLAIQEPGISKYCSGCSREFLDQAKLGLQGGPSLLQDLFEKFVVCPYCHAKFRG